MSYFHQAIVRLIEQIKRTKKRVTRCEESLSLPPSFALLDWLEAQPIYPKFYWQDRDNKEEVAALGQLQSLSDLKSVYNHLSEGQRLWGGCSFDGGTKKNKEGLSSFFFLPQIELIRVNQDWILAVNIKGDGDSTIAALHQLYDEVAPITAITSSIERIEHIPNQLDWAALVNKSLNSIEKNTFKKVVLGRKTYVHLDQALPATQLLKISRQKNLDSFHFLLAFDAQQSFMGSTPERLYSRSEQTFITEALAGTIGRGRHEDEDQALAHWLTTDVKNLNENQIVVDDIVERLEPHVADLDIETEVQLIRLRQVQHLKRRISGILKKEITGIQLLKVLQPTAAIAGLPRKEAMDFILDNEPFSRHWFSGSVGYISQHKAEFCVAIRSALVTDKRIQLFAGAGIVSGSVAENEWQELDKKVATLLNLIDNTSEQGPSS